MDHSIVYISGNAAARKVGGHMTDLGLANTRSGRAELLMNCTAYSDDCKTVKSSSIFVHDETGKPVEARYSLLFERHALHTDSAGAGKYRGWIRCD
jgi:predicted transcriptional regulator YheO